MVCTPNSPSPQERERVGKRLVASVRALWLSFTGPFSLLLFPSDAGADNLDGIVCSSTMTASSIVVWESVKIEFQAAPLPRPLSFEGISHLLASGRWLVKVSSRRRRMGGRGAHRDQGGNRLGLWPTPLPFKHACATHVVSAVQGSRRLVDSCFEQVIVMTRIVQHFCFVVRDFRLFQGILEFLEFHLGSTYGCQTTSCRLGNTMSEPLNLASRDARLQYQDLNSSYVQKHGVLYASRRCSTPRVRREKNSTLWHWFPIKIKIERHQREYTKRSTHWSIYQENTLTEHELILGEVLSWVADFALESLPKREGLLQRGSPSPRSHHWAHLLKSCGE